MQCMHPNLSPKTRTSIILESYLNCIETKQDWWSWIGGSRIYLIFLLLTIYLYNKYIYIMATKVNIYTQMMTHLHSGATSSAQPHWMLASFHIIGSCENWSWEQMCFVAMCCNDGYTPPPTSVRGLYKWMLSWCLYRPRYVTLGMFYQLSANDEWLCLFVGGGGLSPWQHLKSYKDR